MLAKYLNRFVAVALVVDAGLLFCSSSADAVVRTARQVGFIEFSIGGSSPVNEYDRLGSFEFVDQNNRPAFLTASEVFDPTATFGIALGQLINDHYSVGVGFRYTHVNLDKYAERVIIDDYRYNLYELGLDLNLYLLPHSTAMITPYVGGGASIGAFSESAPGVDANADLVGDVHFNFGADLAVFNEATTGGQLTVSSINSVSIGSFNDRPRYLTIGVGLRYFLPR